MDTVRALTLAFLLSGVVALDNGVARTPAMGWNPYNVYLCNTDEAQYQAAAQALVQSGLKDVGYKYFGLDCGWQSTNRTSSGTFMWNATRIPSGIPALAEYVHELGLLFGVYSDAGYYSCDFVGGTAHWIGSLGYEQSDADTFTEWGADYLKYDNCYAVNKTDFVDDYPPIQEEPHYTAMRDALANTGREVVYSICEWGVQDPARWAGPVGNSWRISNDIGPPPSFANLQRIINQLVPITQFAGPGAWNDLDLLEVGNAGLTEEEWEMHFAFWAAAKSPLFISTDLTTASNEVLDILGNERIIAVHQDPLGKSIAFKRRYTDDYDVWAGPLADGSVVAVLLNWANATQSITFDLPDVGLSAAYITDLWTGAELGTTELTYTTSVGAHGALVFKLSNGVLAPPTQFTTYLAESLSNVLTGGATPRALNSSASVVGYIGYNGTLTFTGVDGGATGGTKLVSLTYANADYTFYNTDCSNCRRAEVGVNGGAPVIAEMPISGQSWDILFAGYLLSLNGFVPGTNNNVTFSNYDAWAPDMYSLGVQA
ncbi:carbohydrate-binding module family 35 protein [Hydnomerulius pinastri MD-312]|uniref:Alpha-galactosidase n=1 Tax=Hydnomerulius pinastri MD-312 TaxID=994086 RepID=A0A0C9W981_9AGAM|nr:carbohydrate-binding module family 35 protein [Hydnomerulius pinastri MD-312]